MGIFSKKTPDQKNIEKSKESEIQKAKEDQNKLSQEIFSDQYKQVLPELNKKNFSELTKKYNGTDESVSFDDEKTGNTIYVSSTGEFTIYLKKGAETGNRIEGKNGKIKKIFIEEGDSSITIKNNGKEEFKKIKGTVHGEKIKRKDRKNEYKADKILKEVLGEIDQPKEVQELLKKMESENDFSCSPTDPNCLQAHAIYNANFVAETIEGLEFIKFQDTETKTNKQRNPEISEKNCRTGKELSNSNYSQVRRISTKEELQSTIDSFFGKKGTQELVDTNILEGVIRNAQNTNIDSVVIEVNESLGAGLARNHPKYSAEISDLLNGEFGENLRTQINQKILKTNKTLQTTVDFIKENPQKKPVDIFVNNLLNAGLSEECVYKAVPQIEMILEKEIIFVPYEVTVDKVLEIQKEVEQAVDKFSLTDEQRTDIINIANESNTKDEFVVKMDAIKNDSFKILNDEEFLGVVNTVCEHRFGIETYTHTETTATPIIVDASYKLESNETLKTIEYSWKTVPGDSRIDFVDMDFEEVKKILTKTITETYTRKDIVTKTPIRINLKGSDIPTIIIKCAGIAEFFSISKAKELPKGEVQKLQEALKSYREEALKDTAFHAYLLKNPLCSGKFDLSLDFFLKGKKDNPGEYGHETRILVAYLQYKIGISVDGAFGKETNKHLEKEQKNVVWYKEGKEIDFSELPKNIQEEYQKNPEKTKFENQIQVFEDKIEKIQKHPHVYYEPGKSNLDETDTQILDKYAEFFTKPENKSLNIQIDSYSSQEETEQYNQELSEKRSKAVREYLVSKGISNDRIVEKNWGETIDENTGGKTTDDGVENEANRRTVVRAVFPGKNTIEWEKQVNGSFVGNPSIETVQKEWEALGYKNWDEVFTGTDTGKFSHEIKTSQYKISETTKKEIQTLLKNIDPTRALQVNVYGYTSETDGNDRANAIIEYIQEIIPTAIVAPLLIQKESPQQVLKIRYTSADINNTEGESIASAETLPAYSLIPEISGKSPESELVPEEAKKVKTEAEKKAEEEKINNGSEDLDIEEGEDEEDVSEEEKVKRKKIKKSKTEKIKTDKDIQKEVGLSSIGLPEDDLKDVLEMPLEDLREFANEEITESDYMLFHAPVSITIKIDPYDARKLYNWLKTENGQKFLLESEEKGDIKNIKSWIQEKIELQKVALEEDEVIEETITEDEAKKKLLKTKLKEEDIEKIPGENAQEKYNLLKEQENLWKNDNELKPGVLSLFSEKMKSFWENHVLSLKDITFLNNLFEDNSSQKIEDNEDTFEDNESFFSVKGKWFNEKFENIKEFFKFGEEAVEKSDTEKLINTGLSKEGIEKIPGKSPREKYKILKQQENLWENGSELSPGFLSLFSDDIKQYWKGYTLTKENIIDFNEMLDTKINRFKSIDNKNDVFKDMVPEDYFTVKGSDWFNDKKYKSVEDFFKINAVIENNEGKKVSKEDIKWWYEEFGEKIKFPETEALEKLEDIGISNEDIDTIQGDSNIEKLKSLLESPQELFKKAGLSEENVKKIPGKSPREKYKILKQQENLWENGSELSPGFLSLFSDDIKQYWKGYTLTKENIIDFNEMLDTKINRFKSIDNKNDVFKDMVPEDYFTVKGSDWFNDKEFLSVKDFFEKKSIPEKNERQETQKEDIKWWYEEFGEIIKHPETEAKKKLEDMGFPEENIDIIEGNSNIEKLKFLQKFPGIIEDGELVDWMKGLVRPEMRYFWKKEANTKLNAENIKTLYEHVDGGIGTNSFDDDEDAFEILEGGKNADSGYTTLENGVLVKKDAIPSDIKCFQVDESNWYDDERFDSIATFFAWLKERN